MPGHFARLLVAETDQVIERSRENKKQVSRLAYGKAVIKYLK